MTRTREWLLFNAVEAWLYHYEKDGTHETVQQYKQLREELQSTFIASIQPKDAETESPKPRTTRKRTNANKPTKTV